MDKRLIPLILIAVFAITTIAYGIHLLTAYPIKETIYEHYPVIDYITNKTIGYTLIPREVYTETAKNAGALLVVACFTPILGIIWHAWYKRWDC